METCRRFQKRKCMYKHVFFAMRTPCLVVSYAFNCTIANSGDELVVLRTLPVNQLELEKASVAGPLWLK